MGITCSKSKEFFWGGGNGCMIKNFMGTKVLYPFRSFGVVMEKFGLDGNGQGQKAGKAHRLYIK